MKKRLGLIVLLLVSSFASFAVAPSAGAQDDMVHVCDSSTILLLFIAEYEFGYTSEDMDLATFEKGQFAPMFDVAMAMMENGEMMDEEMMEMDEAAMAEMEAQMEGMMMSETMLSSAIEGEDEACTALRADVEAFVVSHYLMEYMAMQAEQ